MRPRTIPPPAAAHSVALAIALVVALACGGPPRATATTAPDRAPAHGAALAVEDTMRTEVPPVFVSAPRVTLDEILDRVARGEARRDSLLADESFLATVRIVSNTGGQGAPQLLEEIVQQVWKRRPRRTRTIELRHWYLHPPRRNEATVGVSVRSSDDMREEIVNFAFQASGRRRYTFRIAGREILGDHIVYRVAFEPRSPLDVTAPAGTVWIDTRDDVVARQEIEFRRSPIPLFVRGIRRMVVERRKVDGVWVLSRILARVDATFPLPRYGRTFDFGLTLTQYAVNTGLPDSLFDAPAAGRDRQEGSR